MKKVVLSLLVLLSLCGCSVVDSHISTTKPLIDTAWEDNEISYIDKLIQEHVCKYTFEELYSAKECFEGTLIDIDDRIEEFNGISDYLNNDIYCTAGGIPEDIPFRTEFIKNHEYTIYEKIINLCDLMCTNVIMTVEKRLIDIMTRRGVYKNTQYHLTETFRLKSFIDEKLGFNVYNLFPEIKDNL